MAIHSGILTYTKTSFSVTTKKYMQLLHSCLILMILQCRISHKTPPMMVCVTPTLPLTPKPLNVTYQLSQQVDLQASINASIACCSLIFSTFANAGLAYFCCTKGISIYLPLMKIQTSNKLKTATTTNTHA